MNLAYLDSEVIVDS